VVKLAFKKDTNEKVAIKIIPKVSFLKQPKLEKKYKSTMVLPHHKKKKSKKIFVYLSRYVRMVLFFLLLIFS